MDRSWFNNPPWDASVKGVIPFAFTSNITGRPWAKLYGSIPVLRYRHPKLPLSQDTTPRYLTVIVNVPNFGPQFTKPLMWIWQGMHGLNTFPDRLLNGMTPRERLNIYPLLQAFSIADIDPIFSAWLTGFRDRDYDSDPQLRQMLKDVPDRLIPKYLMQRLRPPRAILYPTITGSRLALRVSSTELPASSSGSGETKAPKSPTRAKSPAIPRFTPPPIPKITQFTPPPVPKITQFTPPSVLRVATGPTPVIPTRLSPPIPTGWTPTLEADWEEEEEKIPEFNYSKATPEEIRRHVEDGWTPGVYLESTLLADVPAEAIDVFLNEPCQREDPITFSDFEDTDIKVRLRYIPGGKSYLVCWALDSLYNALKETGNKFFTEPIDYDSLYSIIGERGPKLGEEKRLPTGLSDEDLAAITRMYALSVNKKVGDGEDDVQPLRGIFKRAINAAAAEMLSRQLVEQLQAEAGAPVAMPAEPPPTPPTNAPARMSPGELIGARAVEIFGPPPGDITPVEWARIQGLI